jgi:uncharacterized protein YuzE
MRDLHFSYDAEGDVLYIAFDKGRKASSVSLNDHIILRFDARTDEAVGLTLVDFSRLASTDQVLPLSRFAEFPAELRTKVWAILNAPPVSHYLHIVSPVDMHTPTAALARQFSLAELLSVA